MKKVLGTSLGIASSLLIASQAFAADTEIDICPTGDFSALCGIEATNLSRYINVFLGFIIGIAVIIAVFFLIWGGIKWILSGGDKSAVEGARNTIIAALVGLAITFLAFFIIQVVGAVFGIDLLDFTLPSLNLTGVTPAPTKP